MRKYSFPLLAFQKNVFGNLNVVGEIAMEDDNAESKLRPDAPSFVPPPVPPSVRTDFSHPLLPRHLHTHMQEYRRHVIVPPSPDNHVFENIAFTPSQVRRYPYEIRPAESLYHWVDELFRMVIDDFMFIDLTLTILRTDV